MFIVKMKRFYEWMVLKANILIIHNGYLHLKLIRGRERAVGLVTALLGGWWLWWWWWWRGSSTGRGKGFFSSLNTSRTTIKFGRHNRRPRNWCLLNATPRFTNRHSTNKFTVPILCFTLLISFYMFRLNCRHQGAMPILLKLVKRKHEGGNCERSTW
jgi:hypothetical protein